MPFSSSRAARLLLHMQHHQAAAFVLAAALIFWLPAPARAELSWRGPDLAAKGIHKGAGLPLFSLYIDGAHSSFATQELNKDTPPWTLFTGSYNQFYYTDSLRDERGNEVPGRFHIGTYLSVMRVILLTPLRTERVHHFVEVVPTFVATDFAVGEVSARTAGFGDLAFGTGLAFPEIYHSEALKIEALVDFDLFLPTAHYQPGGLRNLSVGTYSYLSSNDLILHLRSIGNGIFFEPSVYLSGTMSTARIRNPLTAAASDYQLGPSLQALFKLAYHLNRAHTINAGVEGFFDFQYRDDRMDGSIVEDSAERSYMLGPLLTAVFARFLVDLSVLRELNVRNRPEGTRLTAIVYRVF